MLSFELSASILLIAAIILILVAFYLTDPSTGRPTKENPSARRGILARKSASEVESPREELRKTVGKGALSCTYGFGYLGKQSKGAPLPDECLSCPRLIECYETGD
jgi:hypothetical protein